MWVLYPHVLEVPLPALGNALPVGAMEPVFPADEVDAEVVGSVLTATSLAAALPSSINSLIGSNSFKSSSFNSILVGFRRFMVI